MAQRMMAQRMMSQRMMAQYIMKFNIKNIYMYICKHWFRSGQTGQP